ncbi:MAG: transcriptional coactivator p15/PC4 family protein [Candidatus Aminicenantes bacterium]|nr:transcriptional coactivator p15/PC4 family protein [Candidatus Aminicenantes bacterium]
MEFVELKKKIETDFKLPEKPDFVKDTDDLVNLGYIELNPTQKLVFSISNFRGKKYIDIRTWFQDQSGAWKPTKKGIHLSTDKFQEYEKLSKIFSDIVDMDS